MKYQVSFRAKTFVSSHVKISPLLWLHNKSRFSPQKTIKVKWFGSSLVFISYIEHYMAAWRYEISLLVLKTYFTRSLRSFVKYFSTLEDKFRISKRPCNILYKFSISINSISRVFQARFPLLTVGFLDKALFRSSDCMIAHQWNLY